MEQKLNNDNVPEHQANLRSVRAADAFGLLRMVRELAAHHGDVARLGLDQLTRDLFGPDRWMSVIVAEDAQGRLLGYAALLPTAQLQHGQRGIDLHHLYVTAAARGQGIGAQLLSATRSEVQRRGAEYLQVSATAENIEAHGFYRHAGLQRRPVAAAKYVAAV
jgi:GNAT superfamily N-acetyltransferase